MRSAWLKSLVALAGVWLLVVGVTWLARRAKPTPESIASYIESHPLEGRSADERRKVITTVADQLSALSFDQRQESRRERRPDRFFRELTREEQEYFLDRTLPAGFRQMMEALNRMDPVKRREFVSKALSDMRQRREQGEGQGMAPPSLEDPNVQKIINTGLKSFYSDASPEVKMDLAPLIEEMQQNLQNRR